MNKRVLLAWELGKGRGHAYILAWIARQLKRRGYEPVFAVQRLDSLESIGADLDGADHLQAPIWPALLDPAAYHTPGPTVTLGDVLADIGLRSPSAVEYMIGAWDSVIALVKPAALIADAAPGALSAARCRLPTIAVGEGFTLPPATMKAFPPIKAGFEKPKHNEAALLEGVNGCLKKMQRRTLSHLPQIYSADRSCVATFSEFDAYAQFREQPNAGPWLPTWNRATPNEGREIFCYFSLHAEFQPVLVRTLQSVVRGGIPVRLHMPHLNAEQRAFLAEIGIADEPKPLPFDEIQRRARLVVSFVSFSFMSCALVAGIPQLIVQINQAKQFAGEAIERIGVGRSIDVDPQNPMESLRLAQVLVDCYSDEKLAARAKEVAPDFARRLEPRPEEVVARYVEELIGPA